MAALTRANIPVALTAEENPALVGNEVDAVIGGCGTEPFLVDLRSDPEKKLKHRHPKVERLLVAHWQEPRANNANALVQAVVADDLLARKGLEDPRIDQVLIPDRRIGYSEEVLIHSLNWPGGEGFCAHMATMWVGV